MSYLLVFAGVCVVLSLFILLICYLGDKLDNYHGVHPLNRLLDKHQRDIDALLEIVSNHSMQITKLDKKLQNTAETIVQQNNLSVKVDAIEAINRRLEALEIVNRKKLLKLREEI